MVAYHIAGVDNICADALSRVDLGDYYQLNKVLFDQICKIGKPPTIDRFATSSNTLLPVFNTLFWELNSSGIDAFA